MSIAPTYALLNPPVGEQDQVQGPLDAEVTLVEFGDYQCPQCRIAHPIVKNIQADMGDRLRFCFRNFPMTQLHPLAELAAQAAEAAGAQGRFWGMHDLLFENQTSLELPDLMRYAEALSLNLADFTSELETGIHLPKVRSDFMSGAQCGVNGTPTFFINGVRYDEGTESADFLTAVQLACNKGT